MALSILNNIPSLAAQNALASTNSGMTTTLFRLSSGSRINTGADDAAGLAIADGLHANISALQQSGRNANDGIGSLQVADGSLAQVTTMLNRAVTLATESSTGTVGTTQRTALNAEFSKIMTEINNIGSNTKFNGSAVFSASALTVYMSDGGTSSPISVTTGTLSASGVGLGTYATGAFSLVANPTAADTVTINGQAYRFESTMSAANDVQIGATVNATLQNLMAAINGDPSKSGTAYYAGTVANSGVQATAVNANEISLQALTAGTGGNAITLAKSVSNGGGFADAATTLTGGTGSAVDLTSASNAQTALTAINNAIATVAQTRGTIGAGINQLQAAVNVMQNQVQNLTSAEDGIRAADIPQEVANLTKFQVLTQTGMAALAQANTHMQSVLRLLQ